MLTNEFAAPIPEPIWVEFDQVVDLHDLAIADQGRTGFPQTGYLDSALNAPRQRFNYSDGGIDLFDLAAVYLYHIAKAHAFTDGNKRTGYLTALVFLALNGHNLLRPKNALTLARATEKAAKGELNKKQIASIMRRMPRRGQTRPDMHQPRVKRRGRPAVNNNRSKKKSKRGPKRLL